MGFLGNGLSRLLTLDVLAPQDGTLVNTKSGAMFAKDDLDWKWYNKSAPEKIQAYADEGYKIVVFT